MNEKLVECESALAECYTLQRLQLEEQLHTAVGLQEQAGVQEYEEAELRMRAEAEVAESRHAVAQLRSELEAQKASCSDALSDRERAAVDQSNLHAHVADAEAQCRQLQQLLVARDTEIAKLKAELEKLADLHM